MGLYCFLAVELKLLLFFLTNSCFGCLPSCQVLNTLGTDGLGITKSALYKLSLSHFREPMRDSFHEITCVLRVSIFPLMARFDPQVHDYLIEANMEPFFALSWVLTWFSHDIKDVRVAARLFDAFIVSHPLLPIYVTVAMVLHPVNRRIILKTECDFAEIHSALCSLPKNTCKCKMKLIVCCLFVFLF